MRRHHHQPEFKIVLNFGQKRFCQKYNFWPIQIIEILSNYRIMRYRNFRKKMDFFPNFRLHCIDKNFDFGQFS